MIVSIANALEPYGLRADDIADAYTVYRINAWGGTADGAGIIKVGR